MTSRRRRRRFRPGPSLCDVTMTTDRGWERPGTRSSGGRREKGRPALGRGGTERGGGTLTSRRLNLLLSRLHWSPRAGPRGAGRSGRRRHARPRARWGAPAAAVRRAAPTPGPDDTRAPPTRPPASRPARATERPPEARSPPPAGRARGRPARRDPRAPSLRSRLGHVGNTDSTPQALTRALPPTAAASHRLAAGRPDSTQPNAHQQQKNSTPHCSPTQRSLG